MTSHKGLILPFPVQIFEDAGPGDHADDALVVHDRKNLQMFYDHDGCDLFDIGLGRRNHDVLGHQFFAGLIQEVLEFLGVFADAAGINLGADEGQARNVRLRAAVHEVGAGNEADEVVFFIDDGHSQQAMLDEDAEDVADGNIRGSLTLAAYPIE